MLTRINKYLAQNGVAARRKVDELIKQGAVKVNGKTAKLGDQVDSAVDTVTLNGKKVKVLAEKVYIAYNKPKGVISSVSDDWGRKTVIDAIAKDFKQRLFPIGRLDYDSTGLILLTNDGELANEMMHPKYHFPKTYLVKYAGLLTKENLKKLKTGVTLEDGETEPAEVTPITIHTIEMTIYQGKKRQIRRMFEAVGLKVIELNRIRIGPIYLNDLKPGAYRLLSDDEVGLLRL
jgi:pseudouridine synthase